MYLCLNGFILRNIESYLNIVTTFQPLGPISIFDVCDFILWPVLRNGQSDVVSVAKNGTETVLFPTCQHNTAIPGEVNLVFHF